jgi:hypothetical protein
VKKEFKVDDRVRIVNINKSDKLFNAVGTIMGKSFVDHLNIADDYIVLLDDPLPHAKCVIMIESCLELERAN